MALVDLPHNEIIHHEGSIISLIQEVPAKHKFTIQNIKKGNEVIMYGNIVGRATEDIPKGCVITTQNVEHATSSFGKKHQTIKTSPAFQTFLNLRKGLFKVTYARMVRLGPPITGW